MLVVLQDELYYALRGLGLKHANARDVSIQAGASREPSARRKRPRPTVIVEATDRQCSVVATVHHVLDTDGAWVKSVTANVKQVRAKYPTRRRRR